jgi:hypothetical protein
LFEKGIFKVIKNPASKWYISDKIRHVVS